MFRQSALWVAVLGVTALGGVATADINQSMSNGVQSANINFAFSTVGANTHVVITVSNTMTVNNGPNDLSAAFFNLSDGDGTVPTLSPATYVANSVAGDFVTFDATGKNPEIVAGTTYNNAAETLSVTMDHFWGAKTNAGGLGAPNQQTHGLSSAGLGVFGQVDVLNYQASGPPNQLDGVDGTIVAGSAGTEIPTGWAVYEGSGGDWQGEAQPFVYGSASFEFNLGSDFDINTAKVTDINFLFGTNFLGGTLLMIPLPAALPFGLAGLAGVILLRRRATARHEVA